jgi:Anti-sigma factor NepR
LKAMFDEVANAPVPDKFLDLLRKLDGQEAGK